MERTDFEKLEKEFVEKNMGDQYLEELRSQLYSYVEDEVRSDPFSYGYYEEIYSDKWVGIVIDFDKSTNSRHTTTVEFLSEDDALKSAQELADSCDLCEYRYSISAEQVKIPVEDPEKEDPNFEFWLNDKALAILENPVEYLFEFFKIRTIDNNNIESEKSWSDNDIPF